MGPRVMHLRSSPFLGSPERLILGQARALKGSVDTGVCVLADGGDDFARAARAEGLPVRELRAPAWFPWFAVLRLARLLKEGRWDVLCTHDYKSNFIGRAACLLAGTPQAAVYHGRTGHDWKIRLYERLDDRVLRGLPAVVAVSEATRRRMAFLDGSVRVIRNALDADVPKATEGSDLRSAWGLAPEDVLFAAAGRLSPEKDYGLLLRAFASLAARRKNVFLALAGDGPRAGELARQAASLNLGNRVRLLGFLKDLSPLYRAMDAFVISSRTEGLPLVALEAARFGKPVVSTDVGGVAEAVRDGVSGLLVPMDDAEALTAAMDRLAADAPLRKKLGAGGRTVLENEFSMEVHAGRYRDLYEELSGPRILWISWERHRRTRELALDLGAELAEMDAKLPRLLKHPFFLGKTLLALLKERPDVLFVQCPSVVLAAWAAFLRPFFRYRLVIDAHNEAVTPFLHPGPAASSLVRWLHRTADRVIVTNEPLRTVVEGNGGRALVLPDKLPSLTPAPPPPPRKTPRAVFICTFADDEPYAEVVEAGRALGSAVELSVTGNAAKAGPAVAAALPPNVRFTGFLAEEDYLRLLADADVLIDLTLMEDCLVCGGYEAAALGKPIVLSDTAALRGYFRRGAVYAKGDRVSLAAAISEALARRDTLSRDMAALRGELAADWSRRRAAVAEYLEGGAR